MAKFSFKADIIHWRSPSPFFFAPIPVQLVADLRQAAKLVSYGWGMIPVEAAIAGVVFRTSLFPRDETYLLPITDAVRGKANITAGDTISVELAIRSSQR